MHQGMRAISSKKYKVRRLNGVNISDWFKRTLCAQFVIAMALGGLGFGDNAFSATDTSQDCLQNGGSGGVCIAPVLEPWIADGFFSGAGFNCYYERDIHAVGGSPDAAIDAYLAELNEAHATFLTICGNTDRPKSNWVRSTSCNGGAMYIAYPDVDNLGYINFPGVTCSAYDSTTNFTQDSLTARQRVVCPLGTRILGATIDSNNRKYAPYSCLETKSPTNLGPPSCDVAMGDPVNVLTGNQYEVEIDYRSGGPSFLEFARYYNGLGAKLTGQDMGYAWRTTFDRSIDISAGSVSSIARANRHDGKIYSFRVSANSRLMPVSPDIADILEQTFDAQGLRTGWRYKIADSGIVESYSANGQLLAISDRYGVTQTLLRDSQGRLSSVSDTFGRELRFAYDTGGRITSVMVPAGLVFEYAYNADGNLSSVRGPDGAGRNYKYGGIELVNQVTAILDESGTEIATFKYDPERRSVSAERANGVDKIAVNYSTFAVTGTLGETYRFTPRTTSGLVRPSRVTRKCLGCSTEDAFAIVHDSNGNVGSRANFNGVWTDYSYDLSRNLETRRVEASGKPEARTISTEWHGYWPLPIKVAEPKKLTTWSYNGDGGAYCAPASATVPSVEGGTRPLGVTCSKTEQATTDVNGSSGFGATVSGAARTWRYTYNQYGQEVSADGPRTDVPDVTTTTYYAMDDADVVKRGNVATVTDALGHLTRITAYDVNGNPRTVVDPNGVTTELSYDPRQRLTGRTIDGKTTIYAYTPWGGLEQVTRPDGSWTRYGYDPAHRLTDVTDNAGNHKHYSLNAVGNVLLADTADSAGDLAQRVKTDFDSLGRPWKHYNADGYVTETRHDPMGRLKQVTDAKTRSTLFSLDPLGRLQTIEDPQTPAHGITQMAYDGQGALSSLTTPNGAKTTFTVNGHGQVIQEQSSNRGAVTLTYDEAGNLKTRQDAAGRKSSHTYDALNRLIKTQYLTNSGKVEETVTYTWDTATGCAYGIGRLCQISDGAGITAYSYDARGNLVSQIRTEGGHNFTTSYTADAADRNISLIAPTGALVDRLRDAAGRTVRLTATAGTTAFTVASDIEYDGAGRIKSALVAGNHLSFTSYDSDGRLTADLTTSQQPVVTLSLAKPYVRVNEALDVTVTLSVPQAAGSVELCEADCAGPNLLGQQTLSGGTANFQLASLSRGVHRMWARFVAQPPFADAASARRIAFVGIPPFLLIEAP